MKACWWDAPLGLPDIVVSNPQDSCLRYNSISYNKNFLEPSVQSAASSVESPSSRVQHPESRIQIPAPRVQYSESSVQSPLTSHYYAYILTQNVTDNSIEKEFLKTRKQRINKFSNLHDKYSLCSYCKTSLIKPVILNLTQNIIHY